jgi:hypothetical protein
MLVTVALANKMARIVWALLDRLGATCQAGELQGSGRSQGVILADLRSSEM